MNREGHGDLGLGRLLPRVKGLGTDTQNSAFVSVFKKGQISIGRTDRIRADKSVSKGRKSPDRTCSLGSPQGCTPMEGKDRDQRRLQPRGPSAHQHSPG